MNIRNLIKSGLIAISLLGFVACNSNPPMAYNSSGQQVTCNNGVMPAQTSSGAFYCPGDSAPPVIVVQQSNPNSFWENMMIWQMVTGGNSYWGGYGHGYGHSYTSNHTTIVNNHYHYNNPNVSNYSHPTTNPNVSNYSHPTTNTTTTSPRTSSSFGSFTSKPSTSSSSSAWNRPSTSNGSNFNSFGNSYKPYSPSTKTWGSSSNGSSYRSFSGGSSYRSSGGSSFHSFGGRR